MNEVNTVINLFSGNALFLRFFDLPIANPVYNKTILVGNKEGVSASSLGGSNIGINRAISNTKKKDAAKVLEFFTSFETQKYLVTKHFLASGIKSLYDDEDVCKIVNCELIKNIQFIARPSSLTNNYNEYSTTFRNYLYEFLYGDKNAEEVLKKINDITKIYKISIKLSHSSSGLIIFIINISTIIILLLSLIFIFIEKYKKYFKFYSKDLWIIIFVGFILNLCFIFLDYGEVNLLKCHLKYFFLSLGFTLIFIPIFYKLLINFSFHKKENKFFKWINQNKYLFILIFVLYDIIFNLFLIISSFIIKEHNIKDGKNFQTCSMINSFGKIIFYIIIIEKVFILLIILLFTYMEWNITKISVEMKLINTSLYTTFLILTIFCIRMFLIINDYVIDFIIKSLMIILFVISNFFSIYGIRILFFTFNNTKQNKFKFIMPIYSSRSKSNSVVERPKIISDKKNIKSIIEIIKYYHNYTGKENDVENIESSFDLD